MSALALSEPAPAGRARRIRVAIVDDSLVARSVLARMLSPRPEFEIVGEAGSADAALALLDRIAVDVILLDVAMPGMDGLTALPALLAKAPDARVLIVSAACEDGADATVRALTLGAADTLPKPGATHFAGRFADILADRVIRIASDAARQSGRAPAGAALDAALRTDPIGCLGIGASTGGLHALAAFFAALPASFAAPIVVTQHLPALFMPYFAAQLAEMARRPASIAQDGSRLQPNHILVAPGDAHAGMIPMGDGVRIRLDRTPAASGCLPSVDPMFRGMAASFGPAALGVVLSGMGRDGAIGAERIVAAGGELIAQDMESSVVWGMPGVVAPIAHAVLPPAGIAARIARRTEQRPWR